MAVLRRLPPPVEEKTESTTSSSRKRGGKKIQVIKVVREITGLGLKEAKDLADGAPQTVKAGVSSRTKPQRLKAKLEEQGATVDSEVDAPAVILNEVQGSGACGIAPAQVLRLRLRMTASLVTLTSSDAPEPNHKQAPRTT